MVVVGVGSEDQTCWGWLFSPICLLFIPHPMPGSNPTGPPSISPVLPHTALPWAGGQGIRCNCPKKIFSRIQIHCLSASIPRPCQREIPGWHAEFGTTRPVGGPASILCPWRVTGRCWRVGLQKPTGQWKLGWPSSHRQSSLGELEVLSDSLPPLHRQETSTAPSQHTHICLEVDRGTASHPRPAQDECSLGFLDLVSPH